jgi:hypothetical protein
VKNFCNEEFVICICSPNIVRVIKHRMKKWQEPAACTRNMRNSGDNLVTKSEVNRPLKKHRNLKIYFQGRDKNCLGLGSNGKLLEEGHEYKPSDSNRSSELPDTQSNYKLLKNNPAPLF